MLIRHYDYQAYYEERYKELSNAYRHSKADQEFILSKIRQVSNWIGRQLVAIGERLRTSTESPHPQF